MGPLLAAGFALAQGNLRLFREALGVSALGIFIGLAASLFIGALNPGFEPSMEIEARGDPDVLDLLIALASGMVAAYPVSVAVRSAVTGYLEQHPELHLIEAARQSTAPEAGITLVVSTAGALPAGVKEDLSSVVRTARGSQNAIVRVFILQEAAVISEPAP